MELKKHERLVYVLDLASDYIVTPRSYAASSVDPDAMHQMLASLVERRQYVQPHYFRSRGSSRVIRLRDAQPAGDGWLYLLSISDTGIADPSRENQSNGSLSLLDIPPNTAAAHSAHLLIYPYRRSRFIALLEAVPGLGRAELGAAMNKFFNKAEGDLFEEYDDLSMIVRSDPEVSIRPNFAFKAFPSRRVIDALREGGLRGIELQRMVPQDSMRHGAVFRTEDHVIRFSVRDSCFYAGAMQRAIERASADGYQEFLLKIYDEGRSIQHRCGVDNVGVTESDGDEPELSFDEDFAFFVRRCRISDLPEMTAASEHIVGEMAAKLLDLAQREVGTRAP